MTAEAELTPGEHKLNIELECAYVDSAAAAGSQFGYFDGGSVAEGEKALIRRIRRCQCKWRLQQLTEKLTRNKLKQVARGRSAHVLAAICRRWLLSGQLFLKGGQSWVKYG